jgi:CheY-like chemotaxis protein
MLVDDDDDLREVLAGIMATAGYTVAAFGDARNALAELRRGLDPFLILLDLMMPGMSGWEFRRAQQSDRALAHIPVVVVTAAHTLDDDGHSLTGVEALRKPFSLDAVLDVVRRYAV